MAEGNRCWGGDTLTWMAADGLSKSVMAAVIVNASLVVTAQPRRLRLALMPTSKPISRIQPDRRYPCTLSRFIQNPSESAWFDLFRLFNAASGGEKTEQRLFFPNHFEIEACASSKAGTENNHEI